MVSVPSGASEPGLKRLLRRRSRKNRMSRSFLGKEYRSWGEYAPRTLQTTGDHSLASRWGYTAVFFFAALTGPALFGLSKFGSSDYEGASLLWRAGLFAEYMTPWLVFAAILLMTLGLFFLLSTWIVARQHRRDQRRL